MEGQYLEIDGRRTYFPPFVNEVFGQRPYWACTFTSLLNGANVGWLGQKPATADEIRALATASGDPDIHGGSRSRHMLTAIQVRYGRKMALESLTPARVKERLANGWALVGAVTYGQLPWHFRQPSPAFKGGHRVVLLGWDAAGQRTRILDPMQRHDRTFTGEWIRWADFEPAWWATEQLWFREGQMLAAPRSVVVSKPAVPGSWSVKGGTLVRGRSPSDPATVLLPRVIGKDSSAAYDAVVDVFPAATGAARMGRYLRVTTGLFKGMLVDAATPGIAVDDPTVLSKPAGGPAAGAPAATTEAARRKDYDRLKARFDSSDKTAFPAFEPQPPA